MTAIVFSLIYLLYLSLICQTLFIYDSIGYVELGENILHKGFIAYIQAGPSREPFYPLIVAGAMRLGEIFHADYVWILKILQISILATTQVLSVLLLRDLGVKGWMRALALVYIGISPVLVNSTLWVYSEIAALPLVVLAVLASARAWRRTCSVESGPCALSGVLLGLSLAACVFVKGIFELAGPLLLLPFLGLAVYGYKNAMLQLSRRAVVVFLCAAAAFYVPVVGYKTLNKVYNGQFTFTGRASWALYGNAARRIEPLSAKRVKAALTYIINPHFCSAVSAGEDCDFWSYKPSDVYGMSKFHELRAKGVTDQAMDATLVKLAVQEIGKNPVQYGFLAFLETWKMFFWETAKAGQVAYPDWLDGTYSRRWLEPALIAVSSILSLGAFIYFLSGLWKRRRELVLAEQSPVVATALFFVCMIVAYAGLHSFFFVLQRYSIPLAPLWIMAIAAWARRSLG